MSWTDKIEGTRTQLRGLYKAIPETTRAFGGLSKAVAENGVLDLKTKEFVALGIAWQWAQLPLPLAPRALCTLITVVLVYLRQDACVDTLRFGPVELRPAPNTKKGA